MDNIERKISLEPAKNRLYGAGLPTLSGTSFVYDVKFEDTNNIGYDRTIPLVKNSKGETILRFKNLMDKYYWLINEFIPSCEYYRFCLRNGNNKWVQYTDMSKFRDERFIRFYDSDGTTLINSVMVMNGETYTPTFTPQKEGYVFTEWVGYDFSQPITSDVSVYAQYEIRTCDVTFVYYSDDTETRTVITVNYGDGVREEDVPNPNNYSGHTFNGWSADYSCVKSNLMVVADYTIITYLITFYLSDESKYAEEYVQYGEKAIKPNDPSMDYYDFIDWIYKPDQLPFDFDTPIDRDYNLYADFEEQKYTVVFVDKDEEPIYTRTGVTHFDTVDAPEMETAITGYIFEGWSMPDSNTGDTGYTITGFYMDTTVYPKYRPKSDCVVNFMVQDEQHEFVLYTGYTYNYGGFIRRPSDPSTEEYDPRTYGIFNGWYKDSGLTEAFNFEDTYEQEETVVYGKWKATFIVTFYNYNGTKVTGATFVNPQLVSYGEDATLPSNDIVMQYNGNPPIGWEDGYLNVTKDVDIYPQFSNLSYWTVRFIDSLTNTVLATVKVIDGSGVPSENIPDAPEVHGYMFTGWDKELNTIQKDLDVYTVYQPFEYTVTFIDYYGNTLGTYSANYASAGQTPSGIEVPNIELYEYNETLGYNTLCPYTFSGEYWLVGEETGITPEMVTITGETTFKAQYVQNGACQDVIIEVVINRFDGTYYTTLYNKHYGDYLTTAEIDAIRENIETQQGYQPISGTVFYGLEDQYGNKYKHGTDIQITEPMTFRLFYSVPVFEVKYIGYNGYVISEQQIAQYTQILQASIPQPPVVENNRWDGNWYTDDTCTTLFDFTQNISADTNIYAKYTPKFKITIHYLMEDNGNEE